MQVQSIGRARAGARNKTRRLARSLTLLLCASACGRGSPPSVVTQLEPDVVALVGADSIKAATLRRISGTRGIPPRAALELAVRDAVLAAAAGERLGPAAVKSIERAAAARALMEDMAEKARAAGPPTDTELQPLLEARWWEFDRPPMLRTTHAVALVSKSEEDAQAHAVAEKILEAVQGISDPSEFKRRAREVPSDGITVRVEDLDPVAPDGRTVDPDVPHPPDFVAGRFDPDFVRAAFAAKSASASSSASSAPMSPVVRTQFGYHVILVVNQIPEHRVPRSELGERLAPEVSSRRGKVLLDEALAALRRSTAVDVDRAAPELMAKVEVAP